MFCALSQNYQPIYKNLYMHIILTVLIHNLNTAWLTKISMPFLSSLAMPALFFEGGIDIFETAHKIIMLILS